jgi:hypothetical protein
MELRGAACDEQPRTNRSLEGLRNEARAMLAEIYGWFSEGFDTRDLSLARAKCL